MKSPLSTFALTFMMACSQQLSAEQIKIPAAPTASTAVAAPLPVKTIADKAAAPTEAPRNTSTLSMSDSLSMSKKPAEQLHTVAPETSPAAPPAEAKALPENKLQLFKNICTKLAGKLKKRNRCRLKSLQHADELKSNFPDDVHCKEKKKDKHVCTFGEKNKYHKKYRKHKRGHMNFEGHPQRFKKKFNKGHKKFKRGHRMGHRGNNQQNSAHVTPFRQNCEQMNGEFKFNRKKNRVVCSLP